MSQRILWGAVFSSVPMHRDRDSQFQKSPLPLHVRPTFLIGNWFANLGATVRQSTHNFCEVGGFNCTGYTPWNTETFDISAIQLGNTWAFCRCITRGQNCCWHWMIRMRHIFVSHPPHEKGQVTIWPSLRSAKNVKKQQEVSDLYQD